MNRNLTVLALALAASLAAPAALAQSKGSLMVGVGVHNVDPKSDNGSIAGNTLDVEVGSNARPTITGEYFIADNLGIEVIAALPFQHDIDIDGLGTVGSTKHLPPTLSLQYHFGAPDARVKPFIGAGVNYTWFYSEDTEGPLAGGDLELGNSWGLAGHAGIDFKVGDNGAIRLDVRVIDIDTDVRLNGANLGTVNVDPVVYGAAYVFRFR